MIHSLYFWVLPFHTDENGHFITSVMIKAWRGMWEQEKGRGGPHSKQRKKALTRGWARRPWQRCSSGSCLRSSIAGSYRVEQQGREVCVVGTADHVCSILARPGVDYVCQAPAFLAVSEGLGMVQVQALGRWQDCVTFCTRVFSNEGRKDTGDWRGKCEIFAPRLSERKVAE